MTTSIFLAQLIGPIALVAACGLLLNRTAYLAIAHEFVRSPALVYLSGVLSLTVGLAIIISHNVWAADWRLLLTILGWMCVVAGATHMLLPQRVKVFAEAMLDRPMVMTARGTIGAGIGALLCFVGYLR
jgi:hypothetical protein